MSRVYSFSDYDKYMALKIDFTLWLVIAYFLRPLIVKAASFRSKSTSSLMDMLYPDNFSFFIALVITIPTLIVLGTYAKRKPGASGLIQGIWRKGAIFLMATAVLNMAVIFLPLAMDLTHHINVYGWGQLAVAVGIFGYLYRSERVKDTFADFPVEGEQAGRQGG